MLDLNRYEEFVITSQYDDKIGQREGLFHPVKISRNDLNSSSEEMTEDSEVNLEAILAAKLADQFLERVQFDMPANCFKFIRAPHKVRVSGKTGNALMAIDAFERDTSYNPNSFMKHFLQTIEERFKN